MNNETRQDIVDVCRKYGFLVKLKSNHEDEYDKNLKFKSDRYASNVYIHRDTGISSSGKLSYLKVAVHPELFKAEAINPAEGVEEFLNIRTKLNLHSSSNYTNFPTYSGNVEPCGKCYKITSLGALECLLNSLNSL